MCKNFLGISAVLFFSCANAFAYDYSCKSQDQNTEATLQVLNKKEIVWTDHSHSASSHGVFKGLDKAPFSERKGELQFALVDFYTTENQQFVLSIPKTVFKKPSTVQITEFFDNDDHPEQEIKFQCVKKN